MSELGLRIENAHGGIEIEVYGYGGEAIAGAFFDEGILVMTQDDVAKLKAHVAALLGDYLRSEASRLSDRSTNFQGDYRALRENVRQRSEALGVPEPEFDWATYINDEEDA